MKKNKLTDNLFLKIMAVIVAALIWMIVVNVSDPIIDSTYSNVSVEILNADLITKNNQTYEVLDDTNTITVTITAKRSINDLLGKENIKATADLSELDEETGTVKIHLETTKYNDKIESIKSKTEAVEIRIEDLLKKQFFITPVVNGDPVEGYVTGDVTLDQNVVTVQGPESIVSTIDYATAEASVAGMSGSISTTSTIRYYDEDGEQVDSSRLTGNISSVSIKVELLATKTLPLTFSTTGTPAEDYGLDGEITCDYEEVAVAGKVSVLANLSAIAIPASAIDVGGRSESFTLTLDLTKYLPDNVQLADSDFDGKITVNIPIGQMETRTVNLPKDNITITGLDEDKQAAKLSGDGDSIEVTLKGMADDLEELDPADITGTADIESYMERRSVTSLKEGTYDIPLELDLPGGVTAEGTVTVRCRITDVE